MNKGEDDMTDSVEENVIVRAIEKLTDNFIAISIIGSAIYLVMVGIEIPAWFATGFGMVLVHYFEKTVRKE